MKKIFFVGAAALLCFFTSCTEKSSSTASTTNDAAEKAKANNRAVLTAIESGDVSKLDSFITKDAVDHSGGGDGMTEVKGLDNIKADLAAMKKDFSSLKIEVVKEAADGDYLFVLGKMVCTTTAAPGHGMPPNQKMEMMSVDVLKFNNDGKFTEHWLFNDPKDMMKMMGGNKMAPPMDHKMDHKMMDTTKKM